MTDYKQRNGFDVQKAFHSPHYHENFSEGHVRHSCLSITIHDGIDKSFRTFLAWVSQDESVIMKGGVGGCSGVYLRMAVAVTMSVRALQYDYAPLLD